MMTADTAPAWDGRPDNPDAHGWHWLKRPHQMAAVRWSSTYQEWRFMNMPSQPKEIISQGWRYVGPCLTPAEVAAREGAAYAAGAEAMRRDIERACNSHGNTLAQNGLPMSAISVARTCAVIAGTLPIPEDDAAAALAEVVRRARRKAFEEAAQIADHHRQRALAKPDWTDVAGEIECVADTIRARSGEPTPC